MSYCKGGYGWDTPNWLGFCETAFLDLHLFLAFNVTEAVLGSKWVTWKQPLDIDRSSSCIKLKLNAWHHQRELKDMRPDKRNCTEITLKPNAYIFKCVLKCYPFSITLYHAEAWTLRKIDHKHLEFFEMWRWRRTEKIIWTYSLKNEKVLHGIKEERNMLNTLKRRQVNCIGYTSHRNCFLNTLLKQR